MLADGAVFYGQSVGAIGHTVGEICFNTSMTGYQEILTDPSYTGQLICFTFPHIGNVGCNAEDVESKGKYASGLIVREPITPPSNFRSEAPLEDWLKERNIPGISGVDTRALTHYIRDKGAQNAAIITWEAGNQPDIQPALDLLKAAPSMEGLDLASHACSNEAYPWAESIWSLDNGHMAVEDSQYHVVAIDFGQKLNILRSLSSAGCRVTSVPSSYSAEQILAIKPDGIFVSNGPGDPAATAKYASKVIQPLIDSGLPMFGICLGHQLIALAAGGKTTKMAQGHRGANHPVKNLQTGLVEITSQNHGFVVLADGLPEHIDVTHISLFDGTVEGLRLKDKPVFSVQYHPESSPGPHDSRYLFEEFVGMMGKGNR